jgi:hypothetical protein
LSVESKDLLIEVSNEISKCLSQTGIKGPSIEKCKEIGFRYKTLKRRILATINKTKVLKDLSSQMREMSASDISYGGGVIQTSGSVPTPYDIFIPG